MCVGEEMTGCAAEKGGRRGEGEETEGVRICEEKCVE